MEKTTKFVKKFGLHALVWREDKWYVAKAIEVEVASQGKTPKEALINLQEALELYFADEHVPATLIQKLTDLRLEKLFPKLRYA